MINLEALWEYQQLEGELEKAESELKSSSTRQQLIKVRNYLLEQQEIMKNMKTTIDQKQKRVDEITAAFAASSEMLDGDMSAIGGIDDDDYESIAALRQRAESLQHSFVQQRRELLDVMSFSDKLEAEFRELVKKVTAAKTEYAALKADYDRDVESSEKQAKAVKKQLADMAKSIDPALLKRYNAIKLTRAMPVAKMHGDRCGGCNMELPKLMLRKIRESNGLIECENCGRMLYLTE